ncbi:hypothetical protein TH63_04135 [Rufibacter radiotolerans]|uniref:J domain-containing protein n=1 Tax=Rufibacter radiotolerans TaxID=1379910 RepID=A0A0H4W3I4_9BACT|nr:hypothetical protein [Rufibacter radiotolerans]AKQ45001.1 hypothetical protein TH63_04135 [Rufibacter radiotolerans]
MSHSEKPQVPQITPKTESSLSQLQAQFNASIQTIDELKAQVAEQAKIMDQARVRVQKEVQPLVREMVARRVVLVHFLDQAHQEQDLSRLEQENLSAFIKDQAHTLVHHYEAEELTEVLQRYETPASPQAPSQPQGTKAETQQLLKNVLGVDFNPEDLSDLAAFQARLDQQMQEEQDKREAQRTNRQKATAQKTQEAKVKVELQSISKASRRLYTTLAKLLHPDKEMDPTARIWKEEAIKKVTIAYNQDDFFELLRLQMEFMHEQEQLLQAVPEEQLSYYVRLLTEQIQELEEKRSSYFMGPEAQLMREFGGTPKQMDAKFRSAKKGLKEEIRQIEYALQDFDDPRALREFLKNLK